MRKGRRRVWSTLCHLHPGPGGSDLTGGWLQGGPTGNLKMTMPTAFTVSLLSWSLLAFPNGYNQANATSDTMSTIQ
jgi:endoglucanase